jgi:hypothetical protein
VSTLGHFGEHLPLNHGYDDWLGLPFTNMRACAEGHESSQFCMLMANHTVNKPPRTHITICAPLFTRVLLSLSI